MGAASARSYTRNTVLVGPSGATWPFAPQKQTGALFFEYEPAQNSVTWNSGNSLDVLGMAEQSITAHGAIFLAHLHTADRFRVISMLEAALRGESPYVVTYRWNRPDTNETRFLHCRAMLEADGSVMRGFIFDISSEVPVVQSQCDYLEIMGFSFSQLGMSALTLDTDFRVRNVHGHITSKIFSLGCEDMECLALRPGKLFTECFSLEVSRNKISSLLQRTFNQPCDEITVEWDEKSATIRPVVVNEVMHGISIVITDVREQKKQAKHLQKLQTRCADLDRSIAAASQLIDITQEMLGFAALIARHATGNPLVRHASEAMLASAKEGGTIARELITLSAPTSKYTAKSSVLRVRPSDPSVPAAKTNRQSHIVFSAIEERTARTFTALLRDAGLACVSAVLSETELREVLLQQSFVRIVILDIASETAHGAMMVRRLRKFFPALHFLCLVPGPVERFAELQRAGATLLMAKPVTAREIERVVRALLNLSAITGRNEVGK